MCPHKKELILWSTQTEGFLFLGCQLMYCLVSPMNPDFICRRKFRLFFLFVCQWFCARPRIVWTALKEVGLGSRGWHQWFLKETSRRAGVTGTRKLSLFFFFWWDIEVREWGKWSKTVVITSWKSLRFFWDAWIYFSKKNSCAKNNSDSSGHALRGFRATTTKKSRFSLWLDKWSSMFLLTITKDSLSSKFIKLFLAMQATWLWGWKCQSVGQLVSPPL